MWYGAGDVIWVFCCSSMQSSLLLRKTFKTFWLSISLFNFFVIHFRFDIYVQSKILSSDAISIPTVLICHLQTKQPNTEREMSYFLINSEYLQASNYLVNL